MGVNKEFWLRQLYMMFTLVSGLGSSLFVSGFLYFFLFYILRLCLYREIIIINLLLTNKTVSKKLKQFSNQVPHIKERNIRIIL